MSTPPVFDLRDIPADLRPFLFTHADNAFLRSRLLGKGGFADVFLAKRASDGLEVAMKVLFTERMSGADLVTAMLALLGKFPPATRRSTSLRTVYRACRRPPS